MARLLQAFVRDINAGHYYNFRYDVIDALMIKILWIHFAAVSLGAFAIYYFAPAVADPGPLSWRAISFAEMLWTIGLGAVAAVLPTILRNRLRSHYSYRILVTLMAFMFSYLIVFISGGSIEGHFHFFIIFLLLILYNDWRLAWIGLVVVALHHGILNYVRPEWVYYYGRNDVSVIAHALPVLLLAVFATWITREARARVLLVADQNKTFEDELRSKIPGLSDRT